MNNTVHGYKAVINLFQHGRMEASSETEFSFGNHSAKTDKKAREQASKIARDWISENCRLSPITGKHIKRAGNWKHDLATTTRRFQVRGGHVDVSLFYTFTE